MSLKLHDFSLQKRLMICSMLILISSMLLVVLATVYMYNSNLSKEDIVLYLALIIIMILVVGSSVIIWRIRVLLDPFYSLTQLCIDIKEHAESVTFCRANSKEMIELKGAITSLMDTNRNLCENKVDIFKEAAHELKSPLAIMQARLSLLEDGGLVLDKYIEETYEDIHLLNTKLKELLFLKEIEWEMEQDYTQDISMASQCAGMQERFKRMLQLKGITVTTNWESNNFYVHAHIKVLQKVLQAVYENVFIHAKPNSTIEVFVTPEIKKVQITNEIDTQTPKQHSTHIGLQMIERLSHKLGYRFHTQVQDDLFITTVQFSL